MLFRITLISVSVACLDGQTFLRPVNQRVGSFPSKVIFVHWKGASIFKHVFLREVDAHRGIAFDSCIYTFFLNIVDAPISQNV